MNYPAFETVISGPWNIWLAALVTLMVAAFLVSPALLWWVNRDTYLDIDDKLGTYFISYVVGLGAWAVALVVVFLVCLVIDIWIGALG